MSKTSFHVDPDEEGRVIHALEEAGFEIEIGGGPMVDFLIVDGAGD